MLGLIGKKIGMTNLFDKTGNIITCTIILAGPCDVLQIKNTKTDGYNAVQVGFEDKKQTNKPLLGHFLKYRVTPKNKIVEFSNYYNNVKIGNKINVHLFYEGELVKITGVSKGKGFQGVVKKYGFSGVGESTHGQHNRLRAPGSIGAGSDPSRVFKGMKMGGRTGNKQVTVKNIKILKIDLLKNIILVKGSVPGYNNSYLIINKCKNGNQYT
jgi:large subunit ribosomal protein L3